MILTTTEGIYIGDGFLGLNDKEAWSALVKTDRYNSKSNKLIDAQRPEYNIPFAYKLMSNEWAVENQTLIDDYLKAQFKKTVPQTITKLQAMKQLKVIDKWNTLKAILESDEDVNDEWVLSDNLNRTYSLVLGMAQALGISEEDMDNFFIEASKL